MKKCQRNIQPPKQTAPVYQQHRQQYQQQQQLQHQQQTTSEDQRPFVVPTTPAWGDRNVNEQPAEETNNNYNFSFTHMIDSTINAMTPGCNESSSTNSSSSSQRLTENSMNNSFSEAAQLPRKCRLCPYVATERAEYVEHVIVHCIFVKETYVEINIDGYVDDGEADDLGNGLPVKGKKKSKIARPKQCSKCDFVATTKLTFWMHLRQHFVREECSGYVCVSCPFATVLKHHMTFHWFSAHDDFKAFMCTECSYTCVSKSMLTSHMKTHSEVYQFNCGDCMYKTKFCNAMKKHLKENRHLPGIVLNPDGTPNPFATIDVYGSKRGPRRRQLVEDVIEQTIIEDNQPSTSGLVPPVSSSPTPSAEILDSSDSPNVALMSPVRMSPTQTSPVRATSPIQPHHSNPIITAALAILNGINSENGGQPTLPSDQMFRWLCQLLLDEQKAHQNGDTDNENRQLLRLLGNAKRYLDIDPQHMKYVASAIGVNGDLSENIKSEPSTSRASGTDLFQRAAKENEPILDEPLDLTMSSMSKRPLQYQEPTACPASRRSKRKRKATKLEYTTTDENTDDSTTQTGNEIFTDPSLRALLTASPSNHQGKNETPNMTHNANTYKTSFICYYCHIMFAHQIMYAVHMSFHDPKNPLLCALCDRKSKDIYTFFLHLIRTKH